MATAYRIFARAACAMPQAVLGAPIEHSLSA
jgi:hypothetical protein